MNPFEFALAVIIVLTVGRIIRYRMGDRSAFMNRRSQNLIERQDDAETERLRDEVKQLKERLHVLERIAVDKENSLSREIDDLRNR
ncbi:hypothetical protein [Sphingomonas sp.]|uniref:hypothetical protein n=1 Tax=Sphingomonas sp. TaxID=28214 RepID=UPI0025F85425|nr:hypothetical protein [Sphingomonas sp.]